MQSDHRPRDFGEEVETLRDRVAATERETIAMLNRSLYADPPDFKVPTLRERLTELRWRVHAAWLVLIGKADIG